MAVLVVAIAVLTLALRRLGFSFDRCNSALLRGVVPARADWLTALMSGISTVLSLVYQAGQFPGFTSRWIYLRAIRRIKD